MTTKYSSPHVLKAQADGIAQALKTAKAHDKPTVTVGIVMDDKAIKWEIEWSYIRSHTKEELSDYILTLMQS